MTQTRTDRDILKSVFSGDDGLRALALLARKGHLFEDQPIKGPKAAAEHNLVKEYLREAGFAVAIVEAPQTPGPETDNLIDRVLETQT